MFFLIPLNRKRRWSCSSQQQNIMPLDISIVNQIGIKRLENKDRIYIWCTKNFINLQSCILKKKAKLNYNGNIFHLHLHLVFNIKTGLNESHFASNFTSFVYAEYNCLLQIRCFFKHQNAEPNISYLGMRKPSKQC